MSNRPPRNVGAAKKRRGGRPSPEGSVRLTHTLIEVGTRLFLQDGFEATSIDNIANVAGISKRTFYQRFSSKSDLFTAVVIQFVEEKLKGLKLKPVGSDPQEQLEAIAIQLFKVCTDPHVIALDRMVIAEVKRFPELGRVVFDFGVPQAIGPISAAIERLRPRPKFTRSEFDYAADFFLHAVILGPMRRVTLGIEDSRMTASRIARLKFAVRLFVNGVRSEEAVMPN